MSRLLDHGNAELPGSKANVEKVECLGLMKTSFPNKTEKASDQQHGGVWREGGGNLQFKVLLVLSQFNYIRALKGRGGAIEEKKKAVVHSP